MIHGFIRIRDRRERRPGCPIETRWQHFKNRLNDACRTIRLWAKLALEMEELWLQTRRRDTLEQQVIEELQRYTRCAESWRDLRLVQLQKAYCRAAIALKRAMPDSTAWSGIRIPPRVWLWVKQHNAFSLVLTDSRRSLQQFWGNAGLRFKAGHLHRIDVSRMAFNLAQEIFLFTTFACSFFGQLLPHLFGSPAFGRTEASAR